MIEESEQEPKTFDSQAYRFRLINWRTVYKLASKGKKYADKRQIAASTDWCSARSLLSTCYQQQKEHCLEVVLYTLLDR